MQRDKEYWANRARQREREAYERGSKLTESMFKHYDAAAKAIRREIHDFYTKYAGKYGLTYEQAIKLLNKREFQEWRADLGAYVERIAREADPVVKELLIAHLDALSTNSQISRLEALLGQIDLKLNELWERGVTEMQAEFGEEFEEGYYKKVYDIQSRAGFIGEFVKIDEEMVEEVLSYPWSGAMFSDRLWQNKQALLFQARSTITQGVIQGKSIAEMSKELSDRLGQSYKAAERLIRTETAHFHGESDKLAYKAAGVQEYEFLATPQYRTCPVCGALDGEHFAYDDAKEGVNFPPIHPNCRCATVEYDPEDALDWKNSGKPMPKRMTYKEWYAQEVAAHGEGYVERERKKLYNQTRDEEQFERYVDRLGEDAPKAFEEFQRIKYSKPDEWTALKEHYSYKGRVPEASKADWETAKRIKETGINGTVRVPAQKIETASLEFLDSHALRHGVTVEQAREYVRTAKFSITRRRWDGTKTNYYSADGAVYINEDGKINTAFSHKEFDAKTKSAMEAYDG